MLASPARDGDGNAARIATARDGGVHDTLQEILDDAVIDDPVYSEAYQVTPANADFMLIDSALITGNLSVGVNTNEGNGELHVAEMAGAVGAADVAALLQDAKGRHTTISELRDATTHDPVLHDATPDGRKLYAAWQCSAGTADGAAIGAAAAENVQVTFGYFDAAGVFTAHAVDQEVMLGKRAVFNPKWEPRYRGKGGMGADVAGSADVIVTLERAWKITADFAADEVFDIGTGGGAATGASDLFAAPYADSMVLPATDQLLLDSDDYALFYNGKEVIRNEITIVDDTHFSLPWPLDIGDTLRWVRKIASGALPAPFVPSVFYTIGSVFSGPPTGLGDPFTVNVVGAQIQPTDGVNTYTQAVAQSVSDASAYPGTGTIGFGASQAELDANVSFVIGATPVPPAQVTWLSASQVSIAAAVPAGDAVIVTTPYYTP